MGQLPNQYHTLGGLVVEMLRNNFTEAELVLGCIRQDRYWQEQLYRKYFATMMRTCMRYTDDKTLALQLLNDGLLRVFQKIDQFKGTGSLEGWIRRIVFHAVANHFRHQRKDLHFLELPDHAHPAVEQSSPDYLLLEKLLLLIQELPEATRRVFVLYAIDGFSHQEIADEQSISVGTSKWHVSTARAQLQLALQRQGLDLPNYLSQSL